MKRRPPKKFNDQPWKYHEEIFLDITDLSNLGAGIGRVDGWVVMVPFALPGEKVKVRIWRNHKNYSEADLVEVVKRSEHRIEPRCPLFMNCGGCQYQNYNYSGQLDWKRKQVVEALARLAGIDFPVNAPVGSPKAYHYRSKITPHFQKPRQDRPLNIGFQQAGSRQIVDVPQCPIATEAINEKLIEERQNIKAGHRRYRKGGTLLLRDTLEGVVTDNNAPVSQNVGEMLFQFQAGEFFQNNPFILPLMVQHAVNQAKGSGLRYLVDAYCGVGVFCLSASKFFEELAGVEVSAIAAHWANVNARINKVSNCRFIVGSAETIFQHIAFPGDESAVIIDPPRRGCDQQFLDQLFAFTPRRVVYVSCDPATQARDAKIMMENNFSITCIQPFDLFPQTRHIENVITFERQ